MFFPSESDCVRENLNLKERRELVQLERALKKLIIHQQHTKKHELKTKTVFDVYVANIS